MNKNLKQVKKGVSVLMATAMVMGVTPLGVLAGTGVTQSVDLRETFVKGGTFTEIGRDGEIDFTISNVVSHEVVSAESATDFEQAVLSKLAEKLKENYYGQEWDGMMRSVLEPFVRIQVTAPSEIVIPDDEDWTVYWYKHYYTSQVNNDDVQIIDVLENGRGTLTIPASAKEGDLFAIPLSQSSADLSYKLYSIEVVGGGTPAQTQAPIPTQAPISTEATSSTQESVATSTTVKVSNVLPELTGVTPYNQLDPAWFPIGSTQTVDYESALNVRRGAGVNHTAFSHLLRGAEVTVLDYKWGWVQVETEHGTGWISAMYLHRP
jgi:hypothetical protein